MTAWWWIILWMGMCAGQNPVLTPAIENQTSAEYQQNKTLTCTYATFVSTNSFMLRHNGSLIYNNIGPAIGKESKYGIEKRDTNVTLTIINVDLSDSGDYVCTMDFKNSPAVKVNPWKSPVVSFKENGRRGVVTASGIYPHETDKINPGLKSTKGNLNFPRTGVVNRNAADSNLFDIVWTSIEELLLLHTYEVQVTFNIYGNPVSKSTPEYIYGPTTTTAEPTTTISTSTTASITTTATSTIVLSTSPTTASSLTTVASTTVAPITTTPTMAAPITATPTTAAPITATPTTAAPVMSTPITSTPTTTVSVMATPTVTAATPTAAPSSSTTKQPQNNNMKVEGYIIGGCIGGAVLVVLLIIVILCCLRRWPVCKLWRSKKPYETSKDPGAKYSSARHHSHDGNSHTRKQYDRPQKSRTPERSFPNHYNNPSYVGPAGKRKGTSGYLDYASNPPSHTFHDPFRGEYFRTAEQSRGHSVGQRYAPYPQSQQRGRMQQTWYQPYSPGRPGFYDYSGDWDFYY